MASVPSDPRPILGRVDANGRLIAADPELERLQAEAGSRIGAGIALPQLAAAVRVAQRLGIPISRRVLAAGADHDIDMWVRAVPEEGEVAISIEHWTPRAASPARLGQLASGDDGKLLPEPLTWSVDEHLRLITISAALAEVVQSDNSQAAGQPLTKLFRLQEDADGHMPIIDALAARQSFSGQRVSLRDGAAQFDLSGSVMVSNDGSFAGFEGSAVAIGGATATGRPALDGAIQTALRSPLDKIVQSATEMSESPAGETTGEYTGYAADIATAARHLLSVVRSLGDQSGVAGAGEVDLVELASEVVSLLGSAAKERGIVIGIERREKLQARGESRSIVQILVNLLGNAVRFAPPNSAVTVSFERTTHAALMHVTDEGAGVDASDRERIFEPFEKGSSSDGSGLGLAIARRLARSMGGDIQLESASGGGSRFTVVLPAA